VNGVEAEPGKYAETRLRASGRAISEATDKLSAIEDLAGGLARDVRDGF
jgi:hypothetical protein